jgi:hypothetical protein
MKILQQTLFILKDKGMHYVIFTIIINSKTPQNENFKLYTLLNRISFHLRICIYDSRINHTIIYKMTPKTLKIVLELLEKKRIELDKPEQYWNYSELNQVKNGIKELKKLL